jgi:hypothetical protein
MKDKITSELILEHWQKGKSSIDWRPLPIKGKREWLRACLSWSGLPTQEIKSFNYIIDAGQINHALDFYCLLGETFFGYRGYFGQDSAGFSDCFSEIYAQVQSKIVVEKGAKVTINSSQQLEKVLNEEYFYIIEIFQRNGFELELS